MEITIRFRDQWAQPATYDEAHSTIIRISDEDILKLARELGTAIGQALRVEQLAEGTQHEPHQD